MADPITATLVFASTALSVMGTINSSKFNEEIASQNKTIAGQQTASALEQQKRENIRRLGASRAARGASGITIEGSPLDIFEESAANAEMDLLNIKYNGALVQRKYDNEIAQEKQSQQTAILKGVIGGGFKTGYAAGGGGII